jgi:Rrf2 family protein
MLWNGRRALAAPANRDPMLTRKGKYGLKALVHLAGLPPAQLAFVSDIAEANNVPKKFLDGILGDLRKAGLVRSKTGKGGGYMLARPAQDIRIGQVIRILDGPLAPLACASQTAYQRCGDCENEKKCTVRLMMLEVRNAIATILDNRTLAEMRTLSQTGRLPSSRRR